MKKERLRWACRRGMLELDLLLSPFFENCFDELTKEQKENFEELLTQQDPDLYHWFIGTTMPDKIQLQNIIKMIKDYNASTHST